MEKTLENQAPFGELEQRNLQERILKILDLARQEGATAADVDVDITAGYSVNVRLGEVDTLEYHRDQGVSITVYNGQRSGSASSTDVSDAALIATVKAAWHIAQYTSEDPYSGLADKTLMAKNYPDLDLNHPWSLTPEQAIELATQCENIGLGQDKRITNSEGVSVDTYQSIRAYGNSHGFVGIYPSTSHSIHCLLIAEQDGQKQRDYDYAVARDPKNLTSIEKIAKNAAERTTRRLGARKINTQQCSVIFSAEIARGIFSSFIGAISGGNLYRKSSLLVDHLGKQVFAPHVQITEHPHLPKGLGSAPFDSEGVKTQPRTFVENGVLQSYVLGSYSARKLSMQTTGNAGGVHNLLIKAGPDDLNGLLKKMGSGLLITEVMGQGVNLVTGDYSRGASGFWIENGEIQYPVEEITIAGNLRTMWLQLLAVGNDYDIRGNIQTGSLWIENMTVAGD